jgi:hypothetical protein
MKIEIDIRSLRITNTTRSLTWTLNEIINVFGYNKILIFER